MALPDNIKQDILELTILVYRKNCFDSLKFLMDFSEDMFSPPCQIAHMRSGSLF
jgi:hypothetical protein